MRKTKFQRVASLLLALLILTCGGTIAVGAEETGAVKNESVTDKTIADYKEELESISYAEYEKNFGAVKDATETIVIDPVASLDKDKTTIGELTAEQWAQLKADPTLAGQMVGYYTNAEFDGKKGLYTPGDGTVTFTLNDLAEGLYSIRIIYYPNEGKSASIEREFYINGKAPFKEARSLTLPKVWTNTYEDYAFKVPAKANADDYESRAKGMGLTVTRENREDGTYLIFEMPKVWTADVSDFLLNEIGARFFKTDKNNNEIRPEVAQTPEWRTYDLMDSQGFYAESFKYVLAPDENGQLSLSLKGVNEPMSIYQIILMPQASIPTYEEYMAKYQNAPKGTSIVKIEAEMPTGISTNTVYPVEDRASAATSPADTSRMMLNVIGGEKWQTPGQAVYYSFQVDSTGLYSIDMRFRQNVLDGLFVSRSISLYSDGLNPTTCKGCPPARV